MSFTNLCELANNLKTQDNLATQHPLYCVYSKRPIPVDDDCYSGIDVQTIWIDADDCQEVGDKELSEAISVIAEGNAEVKVIVDECEYNYERKLVGMIPVFQTACLTRAGADAYLEANGHNLNQPYIYVHSLDRNEEMIGLRDYLIKNFSGESHE